MAVKKADTRIGSALAPPDRRQKNRVYFPVYPEKGPDRSYVSRRERQVLEELIRGDGGAENKEIAFRLGLTEGTLKIYCSRLGKKLGLPNRTALALWADRAGLLPVE